MDDYQTNLQMRHQKTLALPPLREVIESQGLQAKKSLGQNFLLDLNLTQKIVRQAGHISGEVIVEIGPGPGGLTRALLLSDIAHLYAIDFDHRAVEALQPLVSAANGSLTVQQGDALAIDISALHNGPVHIIANLPYNIATPLFIGWCHSIFKNPDSILSMTLMFQKEVANRIAASANTKLYGRLSVIAQWLWRVEKKIDIPASAFTPPPKIVSTVVHFLPKSLDQSVQPSIQTMENITASAFGQRRKMVRSSLKAYDHLFEICGIHPESRAENLTVEQYVALAQKVEAQKE